MKLILRRNFFAPDGTLYRASRGEPVEVPNHCFKKDDKGKLIIPRSAEIYDAKKVEEEKAERAAKPRTSAPADNKDKKSVDKSAEIDKALGK